MLYNAPIKYFQDKKNLRLSWLSELSDKNLLIYVFFSWSSCWYIKKNNFRKFHLQFIVSVGFQMYHLIAVYESAFVSFTGQN